MSAHLDLITQCKMAGIPRPVAEYRFHATRLWRTDYAWPEHKLALEIEGGAWVQGRHTRGFGFLEDMVKYNQLSIMGWSLLRFTPGQVNSGEAIRTIGEWFKARLNANYQKGGDIMV